MPMLDSCFYFKAKAIFAIAWGLQTDVLSSLKKSMRNFGKIVCEFQTAGYLVFWKPYPVTGYVDTANNKTVSHNEETKKWHYHETGSHNDETT